MISHANKEMLYQDVSGKEYMKKIMESEEPFGYFIDRVNGQKSLVTYSKSEYNHWNYINVSDASTVFGISNIILLFIVIMYIILLIAGGIGVFPVSYTHLPRNSTCMEKSSTRWSGHMVSSPRYLTIRILCRTIL